jgi:preprotein translocase subunit SecF
VYNLEEEKQNIENPGDKPEETIQKDNSNQPEIDLIDKEGHKDKLDVYEENSEPIKDDEIIVAEANNPVNEEVKGSGVEEPKEEVEEKEEEHAEKVEEKKEMSEAPKDEEKAKYSEPKEPLKKRIIDFYDKQYKKLMIIPLLLFVFAILVIGIQVSQTGSFIHKDVSLKGGVTLTITKNIEIDILSLESLLESKFPDNDLSVRSIKTSGKQTGVVIAADIEGTNKQEVDSFMDTIESGIGAELLEKDYSVEIMGSSLGASFFKETITALIIAFILMSIVVFVYFRTFVPSLAVVLAALSDIIVTLAIVNLMGMKLSTGGIAAFLMLVGYSVDTDMLLTTRLLRRKGGSVFDRVIGSFKTGMMMTLTTMGALIAGIVFVQAGVISQIMKIVLIGLFVDMVNTWIQNVGILRYYLEKKAKKDGQ